MRRALLVRTETDARGTFGRIATDNMFQANTVERPWMENKANLSCVPAGVFLFKVVDSPAHGRVYEEWDDPETVRCEDVPNREKIQIHVANFSHELLGCIGLGRSIHDNMRDPKTGKFHKGVTSSRDALIGFMNDLGGETFELTIVWADGVEPG